jgi:hypothetical protein
MAAALLGAGLVAGGGFPALTWPAPPAAAAPENVAPGVHADWSRGVLLATGSCAADLFAASAEVARIKAERLARGRAEARLRRALQTLGREPRWRSKISAELVAQLDPTLAKVSRIDYAATGSVALQLELPLTPKAPGSAKSPPTPPPAPAEEAKDGGPAAAAEEEKLP